MSNPKIIMLCNDRVAMPVLKDLLFHGYVAGVMVPSHNKDCITDINNALEQTGVPLIPVNRKNYGSELMQAQRELKADAGLVISFPWLLPNEIVTAFPRRFFNFHFGPLPQYRGPTPVFEQLRKGEKFAGVTVHLMNERIDAGPIVLEERIGIGEDDTYGILQAKLSAQAARLALQLVRLFDYTTQIPSRAQDEQLAVYHDRPGLNDVLINWKEMKSSEIKNLVRACNPWNKGAGARINNYTVGLLEVEICEQETVENLLPGTIVSLNSGSVSVATIDKRFLKINVMYAHEGFLSGRHHAALGIRIGDRFD